jgi:hypothetical protein
MKKVTRADLDQARQADGELDLGLS